MKRTGVLGRPKSDTSLRAVDMVPSVYHALLALSARTATGLVFPGQGGKSLPAWMLYDHGFRPAIKQAEVNRIRFHDLRDTYASLLIMAGKHPKYIADQMGHASAAFTLDTYGHLMGRLPVQPVEWIDELVFPEGLEVGRVRGRRAVRIAAWQQFSPIHLRRWLAGPCRQPRRPRFRSLLIEPYVRCYRIRLSD